MEMVLLIKNHLNLIAYEKRLLSRSLNKTEAAISRLLLAILALSL